MGREREVNIIIDAQNKARGAFLDVRRGLREMDREGRRATDNFSRNFARTGKSVLTFANRLKFMDKIAKRTFQGTAAAMSIYAVSTLRDFAQLEDGISKVNTLYDQTAQSQQKMIKDSIQMYKMIPTDFQKITQGIYDTISAGADPKYATMISRKFGMASIAGMTDMPVVTKAAMGTMNAFGKEVKDLNHILDVQFLTVKRGMTEYSQLASSLDTGILKAADSAGMSIEELYGGIAQITKNGIPAAQATTQLGSMLNRLTDPKVIKRMKEFGVELQDEYNNTRPLVEILKDLNEQFEKRKMTGAEQAGFLKEVMGRQEAVRGFQTLIAQAKDYAKVVKEMENADGTMQEAFEDRLNNINTQLKLLWNNIKATGAEQIYTLKPFFDSLTEPIIIKQKLEFRKADLQDKLMMNEDELKKEKISKDEYLMREKVIKESIALIDIQLKDLDITPIDKFREGLKEGVEQLEKINPPLAKFVDTIGNLALNFVGEEGAENREKAVNVAKSLGAIYATKKTADAYMWFRKLFNKGGKKDSLAEHLTKTMQTMNVKANIVNVYGKSVNSIGGSGGRNIFTRTAEDILMLKAGEQIIKKGLNYGKKYLIGTGGKKVVEKLLVDGSVKTAEKIAAAELEAAIITKGVTTAFLSGIPVLALAGIQLYREYDKNKKRDAGLEKVDKNSYATTDYGIVSGKEIQKLQKIQTTITAPKESFIETLMNSLKGVFGLDNSMQIKNEIKVDPPKVSVYIDGKNANQYVRKIDYEGVEKYLERQCRKYGKNIYT
ncbi:phage tail tape measure protein [Crassaminicella thermophila]|uniref:Phage tail tape measure protein n=1 Tax=Crassaminicella thermophila TaxID=2599308 RepID=A0A5C0SH27_CRATE|nr:phage tail tape measure protein [Crassaminicella thermophila]QEK12714.1 phage tail tape measure protein [Crassaminicella thermophila]